MENLAAHRAIALRALLRERFPSAHADLPGLADLPPSTPTTAGSRLPIQAPVTVAFSPGEIQEVVAERPGCGSALLLGELLARAEAGGRTLTLVDGKDSFDPDSFGPSLCRRMLWLRCRDAEQAMQATDLLLRDGNLPEIVLDLQLNPFPEIRSFAPNVWHRFRALSEQAGTGLLVITTSPLVVSAHRRFALRPLAGAPDWESTRNDFSERLSPVPLRQRSLRGAMQG